MILDVWLANIGFDPRATHLKYDVFLTGERLIIGIKYINLVARLQIVN